MWDRTKWIRRGKLTGLKANVKKEGKSQIKYVSFHLKELATEEQIKPKEITREQKVKGGNKWNRKATEKSPRNQELIP